eukprot:358446-Chlamydomonas_euryale.AAC.3
MDDGACHALGPAHVPGRWLSGRLVHPSAAVRAATSHVISCFLCHCAARASRGASSRALRTTERTAFVNRRRRGVACLPWFGRL